MVGEIRDLETAEIAIKAAQTGHLVLSTLHTNSAPETLTRLLNMGVPTFNECGFSGEEITIFNPKGCSKCNNGYKGRVGVYEVVRITPAISRIIMGGGNAIEIADAAKEAGFFNLRTAALRKAAMGVTSLAEANRVTKD